MSSIILQAGATTSGMSYLVMMFFIFTLIFGGILNYRKKSKGYNTGKLGWFAAFFIVAIIGGGVAKSCKLQVPSFPILIAEGIFILCVTALFIYVIFSYQSVINKQQKTNDDIKKRQKLIRYISYLFAFSLTSIPFILDSWGLQILPSLEPSYYITQEDIILRFINSGIKAALVVTIAVFFADNILNRIASEIYTYDDIRDLDKFCLYLRSFNIDKNQEEKLICKMTRNLYPVYAIGDPNRVLQPNGAERIYVTDEIWQDVVKDLSNRSKLILLRIGQTDGTMWEITNIIDSKLIKKVIFIAYNHNDYHYFTKRINEQMGIRMPIMNSPVKHPIAFYFTDSNTGLTIQHYQIKSGKDVESMLNQYLKVSPELDNEYSQDLDLRNHNLKYMFDKKRIPESVRKSLNWGIISPIVNMRHWSIMVWGIFLLSIILSGFVKSTIPAYCFALVMLILGNRIEWAAGGWSCASLFLRHQRREAKFLWLSFVIGVLYSLIYLVLLIA